MLEVHKSVVLATLFVFKFINDIALLFFNLIKLYYVTFYNVSRHYFKLWLQTETKYLKIDMFDNRQWILMQNDHTCHVFPRNIMIKKNIRTKPLFPIFAFFRSNERLSNISFFMSWATRKMPTQVVGSIIRIRNYQPFTVVTDDFSNTITRLPSENISNIISQFSFWKLLNIIRETLFFILIIYDSNFILFNKSFIKGKINVRISWY